MLSRCADATGVEMVYNRAKYNLVTGTTSWGLTPIGCLLLSGVTSAVVNPDLNTLADLFGAGGVEASGTGYARKSLTTTVFQDDGNDWVRMNANSVTWTGLSVGSVAAMVVYDNSGGTDATRDLICLLDSGFPIGTSGTDLSVAFDANGLLSVA